MKRAGEPGRYGAALNIRALLSVTEQSRGDMLLNWALQ